MKGAGLILALLLTGALQAQTYLPVAGKKGMVVSSSSLASRVGADILAQGGNAVDAAVATGFALAVVWPRAGNLGGGGFMIIHLADGGAQALDFRETAPHAATRDMYLDANGDVVEGRSTKGHLAVGVPGTVDGLLQALERHGSMSRRQVLAPAIKLARDGFALPASLAEEIAGHLSPMKEVSEDAHRYFSNGGQPYRAGELFRQQDLAATLELIAERGRDGFYKGRTAALLTVEMTRGGGLITREDLAGYRAKWRQPIKGSYRGHQIWSMPPPSSGGVMLVHLLNILESHDVKGLGWGGSRLIHLMVEAERRAYADRAEHLGDPDFVTMPLDMLASKEYAAKRMENFDPAKASDSERIKHGGWSQREKSDTTHFSTIDANGLAVSCTTTLNGHYGSYVIVPGAGFLLNNEMDDFSVKPDTPNMYGLLGRKANEIQPGKRMLSSMTPTIVAKDGKPVLVVGSPGGSTIITTALQVIVNVIDHEMNIARAVSTPRFHHQWKPDRILYERFALRHDAMAALKAMGHRVFTLAKGEGIGAAHCIHARDGLFYGAADPRRADALAAGVD